MDTMGTFELGNNSSWFCPLAALSMFFAALDDNIPLSSDNNDRLRFTDCKGRCKGCRMRTTEYTGP